MNTLYYGDNLDILRRYIKDESVDLVYLDPPFNSNATYNVLFAEQNGTRAHLHELRGVVDRERAAIGVLISMQEPTGPMREEAASAGLYESPWGEHPRLQLLTVPDLLAGRKRGACRS